MIRMAARSERTPRSGRLGRRWCRGRRRRCRRQDPWALAAVDAILRQRRSIMIVALDERDVVGERALGFVAAAELMERVGAPPQHDRVPPALVRRNHALGVLILAERIVEAAEPAQRLGADIVREEIVAVPRE